MTIPALGTSVPTVFSFDSTFSLRVVTINGEPWFVLRDLLAAMGTRTTTTAAIESIAQGLGDGFVVDIPIVDTLGRDQTATAVAEAAATYLLSRSNTETGRRLNFQEANR
jgi:prophage antirepressor-like protein